MKSLDINQIKQYLPHRYPLLLVDRVLDWEAGKHIRAIKNVSANEEFFNGHFPHKPVMPGVLMIESLAQLGGILVQTRPGIPPLKNLRLTAVRQIKVLGSITPGQSLHLSAKLDAVMGTLGQVTGEIRDDAGQVILTGAVTLAGEM